MAEGRDYGLRWLGPVLYLIMGMIGEVRTLEVRQLTRLLSYGVVAKQESMVYTPAKAYFINMEIDWEIWQNDIKNYQTQLTEVLTTLTNAQLGTTAVKTKVAAITTRIARFTELTTELARQVERITGVEYPAGKHLLREYLPTKPQPIPTNPTLTASSTDIWLIPDWLDRTNLPPLDTQTIKTGATNWGKTEASWHPPLLDLYIQLGQLLRHLENQLQQARILGGGQLPINSLSKAKWQTIVGLMGESNDNKETAAVEAQQLVRELQSTEISLEGKKLSIKTIVPKLPINKEDRFRLFFVGTVPTVVKDSWVEYLTPTWWAVSEDLKFRMEFEHLEELEHTCLKGIGGWWCLESLPIMKVDQTDCWYKIVTDREEPDSVCFEPRKDISFEIIDLSANKYLAVSPNEQTFKTHCIDRDQNNETKFSGLAVLMVPPSCHATVNYYRLPTNWYINPPDSETLSNQLKETPTVTSAARASNKNNNQKPKRKHRHRLLRGDDIEITQKARPNRSAGSENPNLTESNRMENLTNNEETDDNEEMSWVDEVDRADIVSLAMSAYAAVVTFGITIRGLWQKFCKLEKFKKASFRRELEKAEANRTNPRTNTIQLNSNLPHVRTDVIFTDVLSTSTTHS